MMALSTLADAHMRTWEMGNQDADPRVLRSWSLSSTRNAAPRLRTYHDPCSVVGECGKLAAYKNALRDEWATKFKDSQIS